MNITRRALALLSPTEREQHVDDELRRIRNVAWRMDALVFIPRTNISLGLDNILGIVPVVGDALALAPSIWMIWKGWRLGATPGAVAYMIGNLLADLIVGSIPLLGDLFDVVYNANIRNYRLLEKNLAKVSAQAETVRDVTPRGLARPPFALPET